MVEKMTYKLLIFGLLCNVISTGSSMFIIEAIPSSDEESEAKTEASPTHYVVPECAKLPCASILDRKKRHMDQMDYFLKNHTELIENQKLIPSKKQLLKTELNKVKNLTDSSRAKIDSDLDKFCHTPDAKSRQDWCIQELKEHRKIFESILSAATKFKEFYYTVTGFLTHHDLPIETNNDVPQNYEAFP